MTTMYYPLILNSSQTRIRLTDSIELIRVDQPAITEMLDLTVTVSETGHITSWKIAEHSQFQWILPLVTPLPFHNLPFRHNFFLAVQSPQDAELTGFAMKLLKPTASSPYVGFADNRPLPPSIYFQQINPYWGHQVLDLGEEEVTRLRSYMAALSPRSSEDKMAILIEKFRYAQSGGLPSNSARFLEHAVILEMLFLPTQQQELSYRFQLRFAKWFGRHCSVDVVAAATDAKMIYKYRSTIAHSGHAKISKEQMDLVCDYTRRALQKYVLDTSIFTDKYLDELCLLP